MALPQQYVYLLKLCQLDFCTRQDDNFWLGPWYLENLGEFLRKRNLGRKSNTVEAKRTYDFIYKY